MPQSAAEVLCVLAVFRVNQSIHGSEEAADDIKDHVEAFRGANPGNVDTQLFGVVHLVPDVQAWRTRGPYSAVVRRARPMRCKWV